MKTTQLCNLIALALLACSSVCWFASMPWAAISLTNAAVTLGLLWGWGKDEDEQE